MAKIKESFRVDLLSLHCWCAYGLKSTCRGAKIELPIDRYIDEGGMR